MRRLIFLVEGDPEDASHYSGIPYYFTRALRRRLDALDVALVLFDTSDLLNTQELIDAVEQVRCGVSLESLRFPCSPCQETRKRNHPLAKWLFDQVSREANPLEDLLRIYYEGVALEMRKRLSSLTGPGDVALSMNPFYPYVGAFDGLSYYIDCSLVDFYFDETCGTLPYRERYAPLRRVYATMEASAVARAPLIMCFSGACAQSLQQAYGFDERKYRVVGGGANIRRLPAYRPRERVGKVKLLFAGLDFARKGGHILLEAMEQVAPSASVHLTIVTRSFEVPPVANPCITIKGVSSKASLLRLFRDSDIFVFPSLFEPFGLVVAEAMSYSVPVVASSVGAIPEILGPAYSSFLVPPGDAAKLAGVLLMLIGDEELRTKLGRYGYVRAQNHFQWDRVADRIVAQLLEVDLTC